MKSRDWSSYWKTAISEIESEEVYIRGYPLSQIMARLTFVEASFLTIRGRLPTAEETAMFNMLLCSILDYALERPGAVAARYVVSAHPNMAVGLATAVVAVGKHAGSPYDAGVFINSVAKSREERGLSTHEIARETVQEYAKQRVRIPGFGHPVFRRVDPRAQRLRSQAIELGIFGEKMSLYEAIHAEFVRMPGRSEVPINDVGMQAAIMCEMGFSPPEMEGIALLSSIPGSIAQVSEEISQGEAIRVVPGITSKYEGPAPRALPE